MSKKSKNKSKERRKKEKSSRKALQSATYAKYRDQGINNKSKRFKSKSIKKVNFESHPDGPCGNTGCNKCFGVRFHLYVSRGKPRFMPPWMWLMWKELNKSEQKRILAA